MGYRPSSGFLTALAAIGGTVVVLIGLVIFFTPAPPPLVVAPPAPPMPATALPAQPTAPSFSAAATPRALSGKSISEVSITGFSQLLLKLDQGLRLVRTSDVDGVPRFQAMHPDQLTVVELIGRGDALESGSVMFAPTQDPSAAAATARSIGAILLLLSTTGWTDGYQWVADTLAKGGGSQTHAGVLYHLTFLKDLGGIAILSAVPAKRSRPAEKIITDEEALAQSIARAHAAMAKSHQAYPDAGN